MVHGKNKYILVCVSVSMVCLVFMGGYVVSMLFFCMVQGYMCINVNMVVNDHVHMCKPYPGKTQETWSVREGGSENDDADLFRQGKSGAWRTVR